MREIHRNFNRWTVVLGGFVVMALLHSMIQTCFSLFLPSVVTEMGISRVAFSICTSLVAILTAALAPTIGKMLGKSEYTRKIFIICIVGMGLSYASYAFAKKIWHMYVSAVFVGAFSCGAISMPISIIIANWFNKDRGVAMSIALAGSGIGGSIITPILTKVIENSGWRAAFLFFGVAMILIELPVAYFLMPTSPTHLGSVKTNYDVASNSDIVSDVEKQNADISLDYLRKQPFFYIYLIGMFAVSFVGYGSLSHLAAHMTDVYDARFSGAIISFFLLILTPAKICLGYVYDRIGAKTGTIVVMLSHAFSFLLLLTANSESTMWFMAVFFSMGISNGTVAPSVVTPMLFGTRDYGMIFGYVYRFCMLGMVLGSPFIALVHDMTGTYSLAWATCFFLCLLSIVCLLYAENRSRRVLNLKRSLDPTNS